MAEDTPSAFVEGDNELVYTANGGKKSTFYPASDVYANVTELQVRRGLEPTNRAGGTLHFVTRLQGKAVLDDLELTVIGQPGNKTRELTLILRPGEIVPEPPSTNPLMGRKTNLGLVQIGFNPEDYGSGAVDSWWFNCLVPQKIFDELCDQVSAGKLDLMVVAGHMSYVYQTESWLAPGGAKKHLYLRPDADDGFGYLRLMQVGAGTVKLGPSDPTSPLDATAPRLIDPVAASIDKLRTTVKWAAGLIVLALFVIVANLR